jgi:hypothetical protein
MCLRKLRRHIFKFSQMKKAYHILILVIVLLISTLANSQADSAISDKAQFKLGVFYNSALNYYGRTDSLRSSGVFPLAELWFNKNFYINAAPVFVNNSSTSFDYAGTVATIGYRFSEASKYNGNVYLVKPFYESGSQLVQSALKAQAAASLTWLNKAINITGGGDVKFSDKIDFGVTAGLDHLFRFELSQKSVLVINPTATVNAGTQQFTNTYYKQSNFLGFPGVVQTVNEEVSNFNILSYEFSLPVVFGNGKLQLIAIPAYVIPQNLVSVPNRPDLSERGKEMMYATLGAKFNF